MYRYLTRRVVPMMKRVAMSLERIRFSPETQTLRMWWSWRRSRKKPWDKNRRRRRIKIKKIARSRSSFNSTGKRRRRNVLKRARRSDDIPPSWGQHVYSHVIHSISIKLILRMWFFFSIIEDCVIHSKKKKRFIAFSPIMIENQVFETWNSVTLLPFFFLNKQAVDLFDQNLNSVSSSPWKLSFGCFRHKI